MTQRREGGRERGEGGGGRERGGEGEREREREREREVGGGGTLLKQPRLVYLTKGSPIVADEYLSLLDHNDKRQPYSCRQVIKENNLIQAPGMRPSLV